MARQVNIHEAKTHLSRLVARVEQGEEVAIARNGKVVAMLTRPDHGKPPQLGFGWAKARMKIAEDFDAPLPSDVLASFHEGSIEPSD
jgi:prevent-host-death family protein